MRTFLLFALSLPSAALAATASGTPTSVTVYKSSTAGQSCAIVLGGYTYKLNDTTGEFGASCLGATLARAEGRSITISYYTSGSTRWVYGIYSANTASSVDYIYTNEYTGTSAADQCKAQLNLAAGTAWYYVDDAHPEEDFTCATLFALQYSGGPFGLYYTGSEIDAISAL